jgi:hypothetical protein
MLGTDEVVEASVLYEAISRYYRYGIEQCEIASN